MSEDEQATIPDFSELIDDYLRREPSAYTPGVYYPSEIGLCARMVYYKRLLPKAIEREKLRLFKSADLAHEFIRDVLASSTKVQLLAWEKPFSIICDDLEISGRFDDVILVRLPRREFPVVVEVKTVSGKTVEHIRTPSTPHLYQIHPYMRALRTDMAILLYLARDTFADVWFSVFYDKGIMAEAVERVRRLHRCLANRELPPAESKCRKDLIPCYYCPWWRECREEYNPASDENERKRNA